MPVDLTLLNTAPRVLLKAALSPVMGRRIQPTGFPDLGAAEYTAPPTTDEEKRDYPKGVPTLLVESAQSMANRLEAVCWDEAGRKEVPELDGLPYVLVKLAGIPKGDGVTCSLKEFHRLNSPYLMEGVFPGNGMSFREQLIDDLNLTRAKKVKEEDKQDDESGKKKKAKETVVGVIDYARLAETVFRYDPNSLVHGIFLEKITGRLRIQRALTAFVEATGVKRADSGGMKNDQNLPNPKPLGLSADDGYGHVPFHRTEFVADKITAYFLLDLAQLRGYGLPNNAWKFLAVLSLWKTRKFLDSGLRLRAACHLKLQSLDVEEPNGFEVPTVPDLEAELKRLLPLHRDQFASPPVTDLVWNVKAKPAGKVEIRLPPDFPPPPPFREPIKKLIEYKKQTKKQPAKLILKQGLSPEIIEQIEKGAGDQEELINVIREKLQSISSDPEADSDDEDEE